MYVGKYWLLFHLKGIKPILVKVNDRLDFGGIFWNAKHNFFSKILLLLTSYTVNTVSISDLTHYLLTFIFFFVDMWKSNRTTPTISISAAKLYCVPVLKAKGAGDTTTIHWLDNELHYTNLGKGIKSILGISICTPTYYLDILARLHRPWLQAV